MRHTGVSTSTVVWLVCGYLDFSCGYMSHKVALVSDPHTCTGGYSAALCDMGIFPCSRIVLLIYVQESAGSDTTAGCGIPGLFFLSEG